MSATLDEILQERGAQRGDRGYSFLDDAGTTRRSYPALNRRAGSVGAELAAMMAPGSRAILVYPPSIDFIDAFFGALRAGVIAVPLSPPTTSLDAWIENTERVIDDIRPDVVLTSSMFLDLKASGDVQVGPTHLPWVATDSIAGDDDWEGVHPRADDVAFVQYTSGSTTRPKGVILTHANLMANERAMVAGFGARDDEVVVSWLPLFHDMGLIGMVFGSLYCGVDCHLFSPLDFLRRPGRWLEVMSRCKGTFSGAPNFAYELCLRRTSPEEREALDLSTWRVAFNGAEPVRPATLRRFAETFASVGFRESAFRPCYGLAEATVYVTACPPGEPLRVARATSAGVAAADEVAGTREISSVGVPEEDHDIVVVEPVTEQRVADGRVGEIWVSGPSLSQGYWRRRDETERTFHTEPDGRRWLRTGDLGFLDGGQLYVSGRMREVMLVRGRNVFPIDVEEAVQTADARLRPGCGAAFAVDDGEDEGEGVVIVQETREEDPAELDRLIGTMRRALADVVSIAPVAVVLVPAHALPKTSSGKLQRRRCRDAFIAGTLPALRVWTRPSLVAATVAGKDSGA